MRTVIVSLLACTLLLFGCGGNETPSPTSVPTTTSTASPAANPTASEPTLLPEGTKPDVEGAANFVDYYIKLLDYMSHTGDSKTFLSFATPECDGCHRFADHYTKLYEAGGYIKGADTSFDELEPVLDKDDNAAYYVYVTMKTGNGSYRLDNTSPETAHDPSSGDFAFRVRYNGTQWRVTGFGLVDQ